MSKYVGGDRIKDIEYPEFEKFVKEHEGRINKGDQNSSIDFVGYGGKVWKFLNDMKTVPAKTLEKIPGHYDKCLKNVKAILKKYSKADPDEKSVWCFMDNKFIPELDAAFDEYTKEGKNEERKSRIKEFREKSFKPFTRRILENVLCSNENIKEGSITEGTRNINNKAYKKIYLGGKVWEKTAPKKGTSIFCGNQFMKTLTLGKGVNTVNTGTFWGCEELEHIYIEAEKLTIEKEAFKNCKMLNKLKVCSSVEELTIKKGAFTGCGEFKNMDLSSFSGELRVESGAFNNCAKLKRTSVNGDEASKAVEIVRAVLPE